MAEAPHHSIGEVLSLLKEEHADITISKIRFFESQGLIAPERTPSGYRKFYEHDIDRLRWILVQQRDNYLPLKVIKRRLEEDGFDPTAEVVIEPKAPREPTLFAKSNDKAADSDAEEPVTETTDDQEPEPEGEAEAEAEEEASAEPPIVAAEVPPAPSVEEGDPLHVAAGSVSLSPRELAESAGIDLDLVNDLDRLGLIETIAGSANYDHEALVVSQAAGVFRARGVDARHLRMFKVAADRQAGVLEQLVSARLKKGGESQQAARAELNEMVRLGESIQRAILRRSFGNQLD